MTKWKHRLLSYAILVLAFSLGLVGFQRLLLRRSHEQVAGKPALVDIKTIANEHDLSPEIVRGALEMSSAPTNTPALAQIWSIAKDNSISKYEVSFYLDPKRGTKTARFHHVIFSQAISIGFIVGAYGIVHAIVGAFVVTKPNKAKKSKKARRKSKSSART